MRIAAVIPTRGGVDGQCILDEVHKHPEIVTFSLAVGNTPFNRYLRMMELRDSHGFETFLTQDDDCLTDLRPLIDAYDPDFVVNAMTPEHAAQYPRRQTLLGFGAIFHKSMLSVFEQWPWERDALFYRESDRIFGTVNPHKTVFPKIEILPWAFDDNRLWKQPDHLSSRFAMEQRILQVTGIAA